jgi:hypothetical protein
MQAIGIASAQGLLDALVLRASASSSASGAAFGNGFDYEVGAGREGLASIKDVLEAARALILDSAARLHSSGQGRGQEQ